MANLTSQLTVKLLDLVSAPAREAAKALRGIGSAVDATNRKGAGGLRGVTKEVKKTAKEVGRHARGTSTGLSLPLGFFTGFGARAVYEFEKMSNNFKAVTGATDEQKQAVQELAQELNKSFPFINKEIMGAAFELGRAGLSIEQIMGTLRETLNLALAGDIDLQESADIATNVLTAMRLPMKTQEQAAQSLIRVNDALSYVAKESNTNVRLMGETFKYVGPIAAAAGLSIEQVAAASMVMAKNGIRGSEAGVAMRSALVRMVRPTKPMIAALERLNLNINDFVTGGRQIEAQDIVASLAADGVDARGLESQIEAALSDPALQRSLAAMTQRLTDIIGGDGSIIDKSTLAEAITDTLTAAGSEVDFFGFIKALREKGADLGDIARIFDARQGSRLITLLAGDLAAALDLVEKNAAGITDWMAAVRMEGVVGKVAAFNASLENLFIAIAKSGVLDTATRFIESLTNAMTDLAQANPKLLENLTYALVGLAAMSPVVMMLGGVASSLLMVGLAAKLFLQMTKFTGAAAGAGAGAAGVGAAGAAAGAAAKGSWWSRLLKGAGIVGTAWTGLEVLKFIDPKGNLWGLTEGIDNWFKENFGFDPSNLGGDGPTEAERSARLAEIKRRMDAVEAGIHTEARRDLLLGKGSPDEAGAAGGEFMNGYEDAIRRGFVDLNALVDAEMSKLKAKMSTTAGITITPRVDGATLRGVHADTGVE